MSWVTVYVRGKNGFRKEVLAKLERTWLPGHEASNDLLMFWIEDASKLRSLKIAIGSLESKMVTRMVKWESADCYTNFFTAIIIVPLHEILDNIYQLLSHAPTCQSSLSFTPLQSVLHHAGETDRTLL